MAVQYKYEGKLVAVLQVGGKLRQYRTSMKENLASIVT